MKKSTTERIHLLFFHSTVLPEAEIDDEVRSVILVGNRVAFKSGQPPMFLVGDDGDVWVHHGLRALLESHPDLREPLVQRLLLASS